MVQERERGGTAAHTSDTVQGRGVAQPTMHRTMHRTGGEGHVTLRKCSSAEPASFPVPGHQTTRERLHGEVYQNQASTNEQTTNNFLPEHDPRAWVRPLGSSGLTLLSNSGIVFEGGAWRHASLS